MQSSVIPYVAVAKDQSEAETAVISHASLLHSSSLQCGPALHFLQVKCSGPVVAGRSRLGVAVGGEAKEYCRWRSCAVHDLVHPRWRSAQSCGIGCCPETKQRELE